MPAAGRPRRLVHMAQSRARWSLRLLRARPLNWPEVRRLTISLILGWLTMLFTIWVTPGVSADVAADVLVATALLGIVAALLRPLLTSFALLLGWIGVLLAGFGAQAVLFFLALSIA